MATEAETGRSTPSFPSGDSRPLAVLTAEPPELTERHGLRFFEAIDALDRFRWAVVDLEGSTTAWLSRHDGDPNPGTVVRIDSGVDPLAARRGLEAALKLEDGDVLWWAENL